MICSANPYAQLAAEAAGAQGKFWEMDDIFYGHEALDEAHLYGYVEEINIEFDQFRSNLENHIYAERMQSPAQRNEEVLTP